MTPQADTKPQSPRTWSTRLNGVMFIVVGLIFCVGIPVLMLSLSRAGPTPTNQLSITHVLNALLAFAFGIAAFVIGFRLIRKSLGGAQPPSS